MCGICGIAEFGGRRGGDLGAAAQRMADSLAHRGPDGDGVWSDEAAGIAFGHRRLAIVDLSPLGRQPMASADGRYVVTFNGEIYNFQDLRRELEAVGHHFRSRSDTEVLIAACAAWGIERAAARFIGIFAFALWDNVGRRLWLARDHLGVKPLYYRWSGRRLIFGSELKALRALGDWQPDIDREALAAFLRFAYVPSPRSIYRGVAKLPPGTILQVAGDGEPRLIPYWDARAAARAGLAAPLRLDEGEATNALEALLRDAVKRQMVADVPLGAFLSGGIDSSTVVALMQAESARPVRSFTIGFAESGYDEAQHAKAVARHLGTDHTELYLDGGRALELVPRLPDWFDEPFADSSQLPTYLVSALARQHVTVALSGDGGDELFAGYNRYRWADALWRGLRPVPTLLRRAGAAAIAAIGVQGWNRLFAPLPARWKLAQPGEKLAKAASVLTLAGPDAIYRRLVSQSDAPEALLAQQHDAAHVDAFGDEQLAAEFPDFIDRMQLTDLVTYLPDDILAKVDRASMAVGLEARVPLLDHRVVELAWRLPQSMKLQRGRAAKHVLRQVLYRHVPRALVERPKMGFSVPIAAWLRGPLRDWGEHLLDPVALRADDILNTAAVRGLWQSHVTGRRDWSAQLWAVLMFRSWQERWMGQGAATATRTSAAASL